MQNPELLDDAPHRVMYNELLNPEANSEGTTRPIPRSTTDIKTFGKVPYLLSSSSYLSDGCEGEWKYLTITVKNSFKMKSRAALHTASLDRSTF
jgi:hypothetical protein